MIFDPPSRPRRRVLGRLLWPILILGAVAVALVVSAAGEETRSELEYLESIQAQTTELARDSAGFGDVVRRLSRVDRTELVAVVDAIRSDVAVGLQFVAEAPPTASLIPVRSMYRQALEAWDAGMLGYASSVLNAANDLESTIVVDTMAEALAELRAGDAIYSDLLAEMERDDVPGPLTSMPTIVLTPLEGSLASLSVGFVDAARSPNNNLALKAGLAVSQIVSDPLWEIDPGDQAVVPATESIVFSVVVSNVGNVVSISETLVLTLTGGPDQVRDRVEIDPLEPDQMITIIFDPLDVEPGGVYEVSAGLELSGADTNPDDNELRVQFTVNEG